MKLVRKLPTEKDKNGNSRSYAEFLCPNILCNKVVKRRLSSGKRQIYCGGCSFTNFKHGESGSKLYQVWTNMKQRILNPNDKFFKDYGGRGITICPEWTNDYAKFRDWAFSNGYMNNLQINRINNNGNYEPNNCNWITNKENQRNRRDTIINLQTANEIRDLYKTGNYTQKELAKKYNVSQVNISLIIRNKIWKKNE